MESKFKVGDEVYIINNSQIYKVKILEAYKTWGGVAYLLDNFLGRVFEDALYNLPELLKIIIVDADDEKKYGCIDDYLKECFPEIYKKKQEATDDKE